jgi:hypothetical protein
VADGREIELQPREQLPVSLSRRKQLFVPEVGAVIAHAYKVDVATLRHLAASREVTVRMAQEQLDTPFELWEDGRVALAQFAGRSAAQ